MLYEERYHLHLEYYEDGFDLEAIAFKRETQQIWDIFFDYEQLGLKKPELLTEGTEFGVKILSIDTNQLEYLGGVELFTQWLSNQRII